MDSQKQFFKLLGQSLLHLKLGKKWCGSRRCIVANAKFSSNKTAKKLRKNKLNSILSMKVGHSGCLKKQVLKEYIQHDQIKTLMITIKLDWEGERLAVTLYSIYHRLKKPMLIISSRNMTLPCFTKTKHQYL